MWKWRRNCSESSGEGVQSSHLERHSFLLELGRVWFPVAQNQLPKSTEGKCSLEKVHVRYRDSLRAKDYQTAGEKSSGANADGNFTINPDGQSQNKLEITPPSNTWRMKSRRKMDLDLLCVTVAVYELTAYIND